jgi:hypothetical protein
VPESGRRSRHRAALHYVFVNRRGTIRLALTIERSSVVTDNGRSF